MHWVVGAKFGNKWCNIRCQRMTITSQYYLNVYSRRVGQFYFNS